MAIVQNINPQTFEIPQYNEGDQTTIPSLDVDSLFSLANGRVESLIYDLNGNLVLYNPNAKYSVAENELGAGVEFASTMFVYPEEEVSITGETQGSYNVAYNFLNNELNSSFDQRFIIKEISANRKELRLTTNAVSENELKNLVQEFFPEVILTPEYPDFYLNFGQGRLYIANNCLFDNTNGQYSVLVKLYEALPSSIQEKDTLWVVTEQRNTVAYNVRFEQEPFVVKDTIDLKGPNFSLPINNNTHTSVELKSLNDLSLPSGLSTSSYNQLQSILQEKGVEINIDYTKFSNFIHFSSAEERVKNFYNKVKLIESTSNSIATTATGSSTSISSSTALLNDKITNIIENFDGFEYYLYYSSGSFGINDFPQPYPKSNSTSPYSLVSTGSTAGLNWLASASLSGSLYDEFNPDNLTFTIPDYILEDPDNEPYKKFVEMTGQHFDTLFTYAQDITNKYNADNRLDFGISKDLVGEAIKSMGINLYAGNFNSTDLISSYIGVSGVGENGYQLPLPDGQASDLITDYITASNDPTPIEDINNQIYKRIYHNLPLLLKQKGSIAGLRTLITTFGIPERVFPIREYSITGKPTIQSLPTASVDESGSIDFVTASISLPTSSSMGASPPPEFLSPLIRVQQDFLKSESYDRSLHYVEAGFSPSNDIDDALSASSPQVYKKLTEDPGQYIGDFDNFYFGEGNTYSGLVGTYGTYYGGTPWNTAAFIRYVKFLDSSLFSMIKDFTPVRSATATGVIIKPTLQQRSVQRPASMSLEDITFRGSVNSHREDFFESASIIPIGARQQFFTSSGYLGGTGGAFEDYNRIKFSSDAAGEDFLNKDLPTPIDSEFKQVWNERVIGPGSAIVSGGIVDSITAKSSSIHFKEHSDQAEFYNGIFFQTPQTRSSVVSNPNGVFQTDNNPQNPYKKSIQFQEYSLESKGIISSITDILTNMISNVSTISISPAYYLYNQDYDSLLFNNSETTLGDDIIKTVLLGNGSTLTLQHSSGRSYTFQVLSVSNWANVLTEVAVSTNYLDGDRDQLIDSDISSGQTFIFLPNWDPFTADNTELNPGPFMYSDYNPIINNTADPGLLLENYEGIRKSIIYQDADYSGAASSSIIPINNELLASGSASRAAIQDSNYELASWTNPRYAGSRVSSLDFNRRIIRVAPPEAEIFTTASVDFDFVASGSNPSEPYNPGPGIT